MQEEGFENFQAVLIHSLRCSGPPSVLGLTLNLGTTGIIGMCLSYCTDPSWRRQGNGLIFYCPVPEGSTATAMIFFVFFFPWVEGNS